MARRSPRYVYNPAGLDAWSPVTGLRPGDIVERLPLGALGVRGRPAAPFCYVASVADRRICGMVCRASLSPLRLRPVLLRRRTSGDRV